MKFTRHIVLAVILSSAFVLSGCSVKKEEPVITVGNHDISQEEFDMYCEIVKKDMVERNDTKKYGNRLLSMRQSVTVSFILPRNVEQRTLFHLRLFVKNFSRKMKRMKKKCRTAKL